MNISLHESQPRLADTRVERQVETFTKSFRLMSTKKKTFSRVLLGVMLVVGFIIAVGNGKVELLTKKAFSAELFTCTHVIGFSQTRQWSVEVPNFQDMVGDNSWQVLWVSGAEIAEWADPNFSGWNDPVTSPCTTSSNDPDRVLLTISGAGEVYPDSYSVATWQSYISSTIVNIRAKYPSVRRIDLQPVIGGPQHQLCYFSGSPVRASINHPVIDEAIAGLVGGDVFAGMSPEVTDCSQYRDMKGHLTDAARAPISQAIGDFYANQFPPGPQDPIARAGDDQTVMDGNGDGTESITLDGSFSTDQDGIIVSYEWREGSMVIGTTAVVSHIFPLGSHTVTLTVTDDSGATGTDEVVVAIVAQPSTSLYFSLGSDGSVDGISVANEDIIAFDGTNFSVYFDGSDVGMGAFTLDAFSILNSTEMLMSFTGAGTIPGIAGTVDDSDIVKFTATALGGVTSGSFSMYFDASDVGLSTNDEDIDAAELLSDGRVIVSTVGSFSVIGASGEDEDLIAFTPTTLGNTTAGTWAMYFDGSDVSLTSSDEDVDAVAVNAAGSINLSTLGNFSVTGISGADEDVFVFNPTSLGSNTAGSFTPTLFFDGSLYGLNGNDVFAIDVP